MTHLPSTSKPPYELTIKIPENLETTLNDTVCIYTVRPSLRQINPSAYTPQVISIGPIHHGKNSLQKMEIQKLRYFKEFCRRKSPMKNEEETQEFSKELLNQINDEDIRRCYSLHCSGDKGIRLFLYNDRFNTPESTKLVNLILLDSVFIIELFLRTLEIHHQKDFVMGKRWLEVCVEQDLILLENQIPFLVLEKIYNFAVEKNPELQKYPSLIGLACMYFGNFKPKGANVENPQKILHFTDLVRHFWSYNHPKMELGFIVNRCNLTKLHEAGLRLMLFQNKCFLEVEFRSGMSCLGRAELRLPIFQVDDSTEIVIRNLMALEQCHYPEEAYICNYIALLDLLIDTAEDVDLLVEKNIIDNRLGDGKAIAKLVNKLCDQIVLEHQSCYFSLVKNLNGYYGSWGNHTMAKLRSVYFGDLWRGTGTIAAVVLLLLTLSGTVCSILQLKL